MRVCYFGLYDPDYTRNAILRRGLEAAGADVVECRAPLALAAGHVGSYRPGPRSLRSRLRLEAQEARRIIPRARWLVRRFRETGQDADVIVVAEYNQSLVPLAALLGRARQPIAIDFLVSMYDTAVNNRRLLKRYRPRALFRRAVDILALRLADLVVVDSGAQGEFFERTFGGVLRKAAVLPLGAAEWRLEATPLPERDSRPLTVVWYGAFSPLHGTEWIVRAARNLADDPRFRFVLVGTGQEYADTRRLWEEQPSPNLEFRAQASTSIPELLRGADICLGTFSTLDINRRIVTHKVWTALAAGRPVITGDGPGPREVFQDGEHCLLVPNGDPAAIADALDLLARDPALAERLAKQGAELVHQQYTSGPLGRQFRALLEQLLRS